MSETADGSVESTDLTPWDRRVVRAIATSESALKGVIVLRVAAAIVVLASVAGNYLTLFGRDYGVDSDSFKPISRDRLTLGLFLGNIAVPLAFAAAVFGMSFILSVYAARLDLDIVLADQQETSGR